MDNDLIWSVFHDVSMARELLEKALAAIGAVKTDDIFLRIASDYILEASARILYQVEKTVSQMNEEDNPR